MTNQVAGGVSLNFSGETGHKNRVNRAMDNRRKARNNLNMRKSYLAAVMSSEIYA